MASLMFQDVKREKLMVVSANISVFWNALKYNLVKK
jgi:hypothetical protein